MTDEIDRLVWLPNQTLAEKLLDIKENTLAKIYYLQCEIVGFFSFLIRIFI
jgi:hypothetical protein